MDANKIIDALLERIKGLVRENAFLQAQAQTSEEEVKRLNGQLQQVLDQQQAHVKEVPQND